MIAKSVTPARIVENLKSVYTLIGRAIYYSRGSSTNTGYNNSFLPEETTSPRPAYNACSTTMVCSESSHMGKIS